MFIIPALLLSVSLQPRKKSASICSNKMELKILSIQDAKAAKEIVLCVACEILARLTHYWLKGDTIHAVSETPKWRTTPLIIRNCRTRHRSSTSPTHTKWERACSCIRPAIAHIQHNTELNHLQSMRSTTQPNPTRPKPMLLLYLENIGSYKTRYGVDSILIEIAPFRCACAILVTLSNVDAGCNCSSMS